MTLKSHDLAHIRSVVLAGHAGSGKTTLAEQVLFRAGAISRLGRVDDGTAHLDYEPEEQKQHRSLSLAVGTFEHGEHEITVVDTPGYPDFVAEMIQGFHAADAALFVMDASGGIESGLEAAVKTGRATGTAACFVLNKCDRENADPGAALDALRATFGNKVAPLHLAIGAADTFSGYVDLVHRKAYRFEGGTEVEIPIPAELADEVARRRDQLLEAAAEADDAVFEKYLGEEEISDAELDACLHKGVRESILAPVLVTSAAKGIGLNALLDAIVRYLPSPEEEGPYAATDKAGKVVSVDAGERPAAGPGVQDRRRSVRRASDLPARALRHPQEPGRHVQRHQGRGRAHRPAALPPRQGAGAGRRAARGRDRRRGQAGRDRDRRHALVPRRSGCAWMPIDVPGADAPGGDRPGVQGRPGQDGPGPPRGCSRRSRRARVERSETGEQILRAIGEAHVAVICDRLKRKFGAAIATRTPKVPYRETIRGTTKAHGRYKKQTGGHGMFGDVWIELEPNPAAGVEFADKVVGGSVPKGFFAGIEKGIRETAAEGVLAGYPLDRLQGDPVRRLVPPGGLATSSRSRSRRRWRSRTASCRPSPSCSSRS